MKILSYEERMAKVTDKLSLGTQLHEAQQVAQRAKRQIYQSVAPAHRGLPISVIGNFNPPAKRAYMKASDVVRKMMVNFNRNIAALARTQNKPEETSE